MRVALLPTLLTANERGFPDTNKQFSKFLDVSWVSFTSARFGH